MPPGLGVWDEHDHGVRRSPRPPTTCTETSLTDSGTPSSDESNGVQEPFWYCHLRRLRQYASAMEFRRINGLPPYVFAQIDALKLGARRAGRDVIDLGFGNPDIASPDVAVEKLAEAVQQPPQPPLLGEPRHPEAPPGDLVALHEALRRRDRPRDRSRGHDRRQRRSVAPDVGAARTGRHARSCPSPSYPIHIYAPLFAGADVRQVRLEDPGTSTKAGPQRHSSTTSWRPGSRHGPSRGSSFLSFPHNPTTSCVDFAWMRRIVEFAREHDVVLVHDFAYADIAFDGYRPPSILEVPGAKECAVELYTLTKSFSMAGWRVGFLVGNAEDRPGAHEAEELSRLRHVPADPDRGDRRDERGAGLPEGGQRHLPSAPRRSVRRPQPDRMAHHQAEGDDVRLGADPRAVQGDGIARVLVFSRRVRRGRDVARASASARAATATCGSR